MIQRTDIKSIKLSPTSIKNDKFKQRPNINKMFSDNSDIKDFIPDVTITTPIIIDKINDEDQDPCLTPT